MSSVKVTLETITPAQCRAGRALADWSQDELALHSGIAKRTISKFESGLGHLHPETVAMLRRALETAAISFVADEYSGTVSVSVRRS